MLKMERGMWICGCVCGAGCDVRVRVALEGRAPRVFEGQVVADARRRRRRRARHCRDKNTFLDTQSTGLLVKSFTYSRKAGAGGGGGAKKAIGGGGGGPSDF
jgi:hypothetical protein